MYDCFGTALQTTEGKQALCLTWLHSGSSNLKKVSKVLKSFKKLSVKFTLQYASRNTLCRAHSELHIPIKKFELLKSSQIVYRNVNTKSVYF